MPDLIPAEHTRENPFTMMCSATIRDLSTDPLLLGVLLILFNHPPDWHVCAKGLAEGIGCTRQHANRILAKLHDAGYLTMFDNRRRLANGRIERRTCYKVFENRAMRPPEKVPVLAAYDVRIDGKEVPF